MKKINVAWFCFLLLLTSCNVNENDQGQNELNNEKDNISSLRTDLDSKNYPHTQPVKIQDAKYEFRTINGKGQNNIQSPNFQMNQNQTQQRQDYSRLQNTNNIQAKQKNQQQTQEQITKKQNNQNQNVDQGKTQENKNQTTQDNKANNNFVQSVIELTNVERQKQGLPVLEGYTELSNVAQEKAQDMNQKGYFSHTSPTYGSPFDMIRDFGINYQSAGENIAKGQKSPEEVVNAWMNSEGHRANILDNKFTHIGVGFDPGGNQWVQMFIKK
ncbi:CAP domain-containing protein [Bacillaceae bacterium S4-13-56]